MKSAATWRTERCRDFEETGRFAWQQNGKRLLPGQLAKTLVPGSSGGSADFLSAESRCIGGPR